MKVVAQAGSFTLGVTEATPTIGIVDYSRRVTDDFGVTTVVERGFARRMSVRFAVPFGEVDGLQRRLADLRATSATWIADERFASLAFDGFYKDFSIDLAVPPLSFCTLTVEGLAGGGVAGDLTSDPAPIGQASTLRLLQPAPIGTTALSSSSVAETDHPAWSAAITYAAGARVIVPAMHRVYESLAAGNIAHDPVVDRSRWLDVGPTNRWAMFDQALGTATTSTAPIAVTVVANAVTGVALLDVIGTTARVQTGGYDRTIAVVGGTAILLDLPGLGAAVTVTVSGSGTVSIGTLLVGAVTSLGITEASPTAGITDFSRKDVDDFGQVSLVERAWSKKMAVQALIRTDAIDLVADRIASVRARPSLWIGQPDVASLTLYGFFRDFSIEAGESVSKLSLSVEGLSIAAPVAPPLSETIGAIKEAIEDAKAAIEQTQGAVAAIVEDQVTQGENIADLVQIYGDTASAAVSAAAAGGSATAAQDAATNSAQSAEEAATALGLANGAAAGSAGSAAVSANARDAALAAQGVAIGARDAAQAAQALADQRAAAAAVSASGAGGFATTASGQASIATTKATEAGTSASNASASAATASTKAGEASVSASNAATSETNAAGSKTSAASSAAVSASSAAGSFASELATLPRDFRESGKYWTTALANVGDPANLPIASAAGISFVNVAGEGLVMRVVSGQGTGYFISRFNTPKITGRKIRVTARVRITAGAAEYVRPYLYGTNTSGAYATYTGYLGQLVPAGVWTDISNIVDVGTSPIVGSWADTVRLGIGLDWDNAGAAGHTYEFSRLFIEDITDSALAQSFAIAAAGSSSTAGVARTGAETAASAAQTAKTDAQTAKGQSEAFASQASASKDTAAGHAGSASASAGVSSTSRDAAIVAKDASVAAKDAALAAQGVAQGHATAASTSASTASTKATDAGQSANAAQGSATIASTKAGEASTSASQASTSASDALGSQNAAATSAGVSSTSRDQAVVAKDASVAAQGVAQGHATAAAGAASSAATQAGLADQRASAANTSATTASTKAGEASTSAGQASTSASDALGSKNAAASSAGVSSTARDQSVTAKDAAVAAKDAALAAQGVAQGHATAAAGSASTASTQAGLAEQRASAANTSATNATTRASEAATSASQASTSASNALGSSNTASSSAALSASSAAGAFTSELATVPFDFRENGKYWTRQLSNLGDPANGPFAASPGVTLVDVAGEGRVAEVVAGQGTGYFISRFNIPKANARKLRLTLRVRQTAGAASDMRPYFYGANTAGSYTTYAGYVGQAIPSNGVWVDLTTTIVVGVSAITGGTWADTARIGLGVDWSPGAGAVFQFSRFRIEDVTESDAASGAATAAATSASTASTKATEAGTSATAANQSRLDAQAAAGTSTSQASVATGAAATATGKASEATSSAALAASTVAHFTDGRIVPLESRVATAEGAVADVQGRVEAYSVKEVVAGGAAAFISFRAKDDAGVLTSDVAIGARTISLFNQQGNQWVRAMYMAGGNALFTGGLQANAFIRLGSGEGWPVALKSRDISVSDGEVVTFGVNLGGLPSIGFAANNLAALAAGETYRLYADSLTATGFIARLRISVPGTPSNYDLTAPTTPGTGPTFQMDKAALPDSTDGNYRLKFSGTTAIYGSYTYDGSDPGGPNVLPQAQ